MTRISTSQLCWPFIFENMIEQGGREYKQWNSTLFNSRRGGEVCLALRRLNTDGWLQNWFFCWLYRLPFATFSRVRFKWIGQRLDRSSLILPITFITAHHLPVLAIKGRMKGKSFKTFQHFTLTYWQAAYQLGHLYLYLSLSSEWPSMQSDISCLIRCALIPINALSRLDFYPYKETARGLRMQL